jgi:hypothetical protein
MRYDRIDTNGKSWPMVADGRKIRPLISTPHFLYLKTMITAAVSSRNKMKSIRTLRTATKLADDDVRKLNLQTLF